jgi:hypothetical protein
MAATLLYSCFLLENTSWLSLISDWPSDIPLRLSKSPTGVLVFRDLRWKIGVEISGSLRLSCGHRSFGLETFEHYGRDACCLYYQERVCDRDVVIVQKLPIDIIRDVQQNIPPETHGRYGRGFPASKQDDRRKKKNCHLTGSNFATQRTIAT